MKLRQKLLKFSKKRLPVSYHRKKLMKGLIFLAHEFDKCGLKKIRQKITIRLLFEYLLKIKFKSQLINLNTFKMLD